MMTEKAMDWLFTDENMATAIVIAGFYLFSFASYMTARWTSRPLQRDRRFQRTTMPSTHGVK